VHGESVVLYGVGSPVVADVEVSLARAGCRLAAGVRNVPGDVWLENPNNIVDASELPPDLLRLPYLVPLFTPGHRQHAMKEACRAGFAHPYVLVDPTAAVPPGWTPDAGTFVNGACAIGAAARVAEFVFINRGASVGHHSVVEAFASIGPGVTIAGQVTVGKGACLGAGAVVLPTITIGRNAVVGAGAVVTHDVPDHALVIGNPAKVVKTGIAGYHDVTVT
jgi:sugar O-acyltransferase (sialic acid O-acetyltransferase NeuD family)